MKKLLAILLAVMMVFALAACGDGETASDTSKKPGEKSGEKIPEEGTPLEKMLDRAGVKLEDIQPAEETFDMVFDEDDDEITFYMEKDIERNASAYMHKVQDACKAASDDGKLYEANFNFFMGTEYVEYPPLPSAEEIDSGLMYLMQFGYIKDGQTVTVTAARITDMHPDRSDDVYYPTYTISFGF